MQKSIEKDAPTDDSKSSFDERGADEVNNEETGCRALRCLSVSLAVWTYIIAPKLC